MQLKTAIPLIKFSAIFSSEAGESRQTIVEAAIEQYRRRIFLEGLNQDFKTLKEDPQAWQEELAERSLWGNTLLDGDEVEHRLRIIFAR